MAARKRSERAAAKSPAAPKAAAPKDGEVSRLERLLALMHEHGLAELEIGADGRSIRMSKTVAPTYALPMGAPVGVSVPLASAAGAAKKPEKAAGEPFLSPMVGTFYRASSPEAKAFVMEGDSIKADATLCIIEAMKVMNEIKAEKSGKVVEILVENGEAVEYGQPLFLIQY